MSADSRVVVRAELRESTRPAVRPLGEVGRLGLNIDREMAHLVDYRPDVKSAGIGESHLAIYEGCGVCSVQFQSGHGESAPV